MTLKAAIKGSILAEPDACSVTKMAFPFGSTYPLPIRRGDDRIALLPELGR
jgi:hypothetical protein